MPPADAPTPTLPAGDLEAARDAACAALRDGGAIVLPTDTV